MERVEVCTKCYELFTGRLLRNNTPIHTKHSDKQRPRKIVCVNSSQPENLYTCFSPCHNFRNAWHGVSNPLHCIGKRSYRFTHPLIILALNSK